jgi:hypothetical protein
MIKCFGLRKCNTSRRQQLLLDTLDQPNTHVGIHVLGFCICSRSYVAPRERSVARLFCLFCQTFFRDASLHTVQVVSVMSTSHMVMRCGYQPSYWTMSLRKPRPKATPRNYHLLICRQMRTYNGPSTAAMTAKSRLQRPRKVWGGACGSCGADFPRSAAPHNQTKVVINN